MGKNKSRPGFWTGVFVGMAASWAISRIHPNLNRIAEAGYDFFAPWYDSALTYVSSMAEIRRKMVDELELKPGDQVLEVCVGTGENLPFIAQRIGPTGKVYGIDISEGMLNVAREKIKELPCPVELRWGNAEELPFPDNSFDAVLNLGAMNFITDRKKAIDEMERVAKPGAKLVIGDETLAPDGPIQSLLSLITLDLIPRLRAPIDLVGHPDAELFFGLNNKFYVIHWRKPVQEQ